MAFLFTILTHHNENYSKNVTQKNGHTNPNKRTAGLNLHHYWAIHFEPAPHVLAHLQTPANQWSMTSCDPPRPVVDHDVLATPCSRAAARGTEAVSLCTNYEQDIRMRWVWTCIWTRANNQNQRRQKGGNKKAEKPSIHAYPDSVVNPVSSAPDDGQGIQSLHSPGKAALSWKWSKWTYLDAKWPVFKFSLSIARLTISTPPSTTNKITKRRNSVSEVIGILSQSQTVEGNRESWKIRKPTILNRVLLLYQLIWWFKTGRSSSFRYRKARLD